MRYLKNPNKLFYVLSKNIKDKVEMIFGFSLYATSLQVILATYFRSRLGKLSKLGLSEGGKMCYCQYWKRLLVLVNFQNKTSIV